MKKKQKRIFKPTKGGRTVRAPEARLTPQDLETLRAILAARGISFADWLTEKINLK